MAVTSSPLSSGAAGSGPGDQGRPGGALADPAVVFGVVVAAALFGILTRPIGFLAAFWPANALLLGLFVRVPRLATRWGWLAAAAAYVLADVLTGERLSVLVWLATGNLLFAATGYVICRRLPEDVRRLHGPVSVLHLFVVCMAAALAASAVGAVAAPTVLNREPVSGFAFWLVSEFANGIVILPVVLTAPAWHDMVRGWRDHVRTSGWWASVAPLLAVAVSAVAGTLVGGAGAIAFPVPALLWCALSYSLFGTALLTLAVSAWEMIAVSAGLLPFPMPDDLVAGTMSIRLGVALLALGPVTVASVNSARNDLMASLLRASTYDFLTEVLTRSGFMQRAESLLEEAAGSGYGVSVLMLDIDDFKGVNDRYGHAAGDEILVAFARTVAALLRAGDLFGRLGGEEFAVVLPAVGREAAAGTAERLRAAVSRTEVVLKDGTVIATTVSVGLAHATASGVTIDALLSAADHALYRAKLDGRNRVVAIDYQKSGIGLAPAGHSLSRRGRSRSDPT